MGLDLAEVGTPRLSWRRLSVLIKQLADRPDSSTHRSLLGHYADWPLTTALMARMTHAVEVANWQRSVLNWDEKKHGRPPQPPEPIRPDGATPPEAKSPEVTAAALLDFNRRTRRKAVA